MSTISTIGDGVTTRFSLPNNSGFTAATVDGSNTVPTIVRPDFVQFASAPANGSVVVLSYQDVLDTSALPLTSSGAVLIGSSREKFFDNFSTFDTVNTWEVLQTGPDMEITGPLGGGVAGSTPYIKVASGVTPGKTVLLSRAAFSLPLDVRYQISASQRIANSRLTVALVECTETGALVTDTTYGSGEELLDARNAVGQMHDGATATTAKLIVRAAGSALDTVTNAFGTGFTTVATGATPNFISATTYGFSAERDRINTRAWGQNLLTNTGPQFGYDRVMVNPSKLYRLAFIIENSGVPASSTDWRIHMVNVMDAARLDVSPRNAGSTDQSKAFPVLATLAGGSLQGAGTPGSPATPYFVNSLASTNGALVLTGTSGLQAFYATNTGAAAAYVKLYNKATAPTVGTDVPEMIIPVPAAVGGVPGVAQVTPGFTGYRFALGLGIAITGGAADSDTTAVAAGQVKVKLSRTV